MANTWLALATGVILGGAAGAGMVLWLGGGRAASIERATTASERAARDVESADDAPDLDTRRPAADPSVAESSREMPEGAAHGPLISEQLRSHAYEGLRKGWSAEREDAVPDEQLTRGFREFEHLVLTSPEQIGRTLAQQQTKAEQALEDARTGGAMTLLERLDAGGVGPLPELVNDAKAFEALLARDTSERFVPVGRDTSTLDEALSDGVTLSFPSGVFGVDNVLEQQKQCSRDVTLVGAGMNATLIVLREDFSCRGPLRRFSIRDCTIHTDGNYLFDQRQGGVTLLLERVRVIGFDSGAGGSCCMSFNDGVVLLARGCRFEGGYGRWQDGTLFDVRTDALVARFEQCTVSNISLRMHFIRPGSTVLFQSCALIDMHDDPLAMSDQRPGVIFSNTSVTRLAPSESGPPKLDLDALFPGWKEQLQQ